MTSLNASSFQYCQSLERSLEVSQVVRKLNVFACSIIILVGLVGNALGVFVFIQKRFRHHSSSIYLLFLCLSDGLFLFVHFFEDTLRTVLDIFYNDTPSYVQHLISCNKTTSWQVTRGRSSLIGATLRAVNITDRFDVACRFVNFLRYFLRFLSAYLIIAFTMQRTTVLRFPLHRAKFESNRLAATSVKVLILIGVSVNSWVSFFNLKYL